MPLKFVWVHSLMFINFNIIEYIYLIMREYQQPRLKSILSQPGSIVIKMLPEMPRMHVVITSALQ